MSAPRKPRAERQHEVDEGPPAPPTASQQIEALNARRFAGGGFIIPRPDPLNPGTFRAWLREVADVGSPGDVEIAWHGYDNAHAKLQLENEYAALKDNTGRRYHVLERQAAQERALASARAAKQSERARTMQRIAAHRAEVDALERKLAQM